MGCFEPFTETAGAAPSGLVHSYPWYTTMSNTTIFESGSNSGDGATSFVISSSFAATLSRGGSVLLSANFCDPSLGTSRYRTGSLKRFPRLGAAEGQSDHRALDCCRGVTWPDRLCGRPALPHASGGTYRFAGCWVICVLRSAPVPNARGRVTKAICGCRSHSARFRSAVFWLLDFSLIGLGD